MTVLLCVPTAFHCSDSGTEPVGLHGLVLTAEDASCTEVWLEVKLAAGLQPRTLTLQRDTQTVLSTTLISTDTLIVDQGLVPNRQYTYTLTRPNGLFTELVTATITTMDTTSHDWVFDPPVLFGDGSSSVLYDVAIINDTLAYAVGEIYKRDSLGNWDPLPYNLVKWDGQQWELKRVTVQTSSGPVTAPLYGIYAFAANDIWLTSGVPIHGNSQIWVQYHLFQMGVLGPNDGSLTKIWGSSSSNVYFVGNRGTIAHYSHGTWQRLESGTTQPITDIWGDLDSATGENVAIALASNIYQGGEKKVLRIVGNAVTQLNSDGLPWALSGVWFKRNRYFIAGDGLFKRRCLGCISGWQRFHSGLANYYSNAIRGVEADIVVGGSFGELITFNGATWRNHLPETFMSPGSFYRVAIKTDFFVAVGHKNFRGCVLVGRRF
jgi:hypothetical protein